MQQQLLLHLPERMVRRYPRRRCYLKLQHHIQQEERHRSHEPSVQQRERLVAAHY
jgi:hypothetical protein